MFREAHFVNTLLSLLKWTKENSEIKLQIFIINSIISTSLCSTATRLFIWLKTQNYCTLYYQSMEWTSLLCLMGIRKNVPQSKRGKTEGLSGQQQINESKIYFLNNKINIFFCGFIPVIVAENDADLGLVRTEINSLLNDCTVVVVGSDVYLLVLLISPSSENAKLYFCKLQLGKTPSPVSYSIDIFISE